MDMREDPVYNAPIESLQHMLRSIAYLDNSIPLVHPDGVFGEATKNAVVSFQQKHGLPATGIADRQTHAAIVNVYEAADALLRPAEPAVIHFPAPLVVLEDQFHPYVYLVQAMFNALHNEFPAFVAVPVVGILDSVTSNNLRNLQSVSDLPQNGSLDKLTLDSINRLYRSQFDRVYPVSQG